MKEEDYIEVQKIVTNDFFLCSMLKQIKHFFGSMALCG
jgi:hypothetical protein